MAEIFRVLLQGDVWVLSSASTTQAFPTQAGAIAAGRKRAREQVPSQLLILDGKGRLKRIHRYTATGTSGRR